MDLLDKGFDLITPYGSNNKKLKDFADSDFCFLSESDKIKLLQEFKEEYQALKHTYDACVEEYYSQKVLKCKDCDSDARLMLANIGFQQP